MRRQRIGTGLGLAAWLAASLFPADGLDAQEVGPPPPVPGQELPEVLTRGPVHEAFAEPVDLQNQEPLYAPEAPPEPINEAPPAEQPEGNYVWVPGYWAWDTDRGFIWVSACWRIAPPGMYWVPGYWMQDANRWQWISGFWSPAGEQEIEYLPPPPALANVEPPGPTPDNGVWVPPCWYWANGQYVLRPGYWLTNYPDWIWEPSHYSWTPRGYVFVQGYWDYAWDRRGILYAPVYFPRTYYATVQPVYTPSVILDLGLLTLNFFAYPRYRHYCFGDYYEDSYLRLGIYPWYDSVSRYSWYDSIYLHQRWRHRHEDPYWDDHIRDRYRNCYQNKDARPSRTYREHRQRVDRLPERDRDENRLAYTLAEAAARKGSTVRLSAVNDETRRRVERQGVDLRQFRSERVRWEAQPSAREGDRDRGSRSDAVPVPEERRIQEGRDDGGAGPAPETRRTPETGISPSDRERIGRDRDSRGPVTPETGAPDRTPDPFAPPSGDTREGRPGRPERSRDDRSESPEITPQPQPREPRVLTPAPTPLPQPQPRVTTPQPQPQPREPRVLTPAPTPLPQPQPRVTTPQPQPQPREPRVLTPAPTPLPQPQPRVTTPQPQPQPREPRVLTPAPTPLPQPQPRVATPQPQPQPREPRVLTPAPTPQSRAPQPQAQPEPRITAPIQPAPRVRATRPERVTIPTPPAPAPGPSVTAPPAPASEMRSRREGRDVQLDEDGRPIEGRIR
jgi:hypothetical protein